MEIQTENKMEDMKLIIAALCAFQAKLQNQKKDTDNPFFKSKYADLAGVWEACRPLMAENGLCFVQDPSTENNWVTVTGTLYHTSGQKITTVLRGAAKDATPQSIGSAITYFRRYQMCSILGVAAEDDDGEAAQDREKKPKTLKQELGPFAGGKPAYEHDQEQAAKEATKGNPKGQIDQGSFEDKIKSGKVAAEGKRGNGVPWKLFSIETEGHGVFTTFSTTVYEDARTAATEGCVVLVHSEPTPKGPSIVGIEFIGAAVQN